MNQTCRVCGEVAAGYHFGAFTCEGCKSFFGRTYNNRSSIGECKNQNQCIINKKNRTSCKSCRLKKCFAVGMSKSGSRYGRRSNWFKIHCLLQDQQQQQQPQQQQHHQPQQQQQITHDQHQQQQHQLDQQHLNPLSSMDPIQASAALSSLAASMAAAQQHQQQQPQQQQITLEQQPLDQQHLNPLSSLDPIQARAALSSLAASMAAAQQQQQQQQHHQHQQQHQHQHQQQQNALNAMDLSVSSMDPIQASAALSIAQVLMYNLLVSQRPQ